MLPSPLADGLGNSFDEFVATAGIMVALFVVFSAFGKRERPRRIPAWAHVLLGLAIGAGSVAVSQLYIKVRPAKIRIASTVKLEVIEPQSGATVHKPKMTVAVRITGGHIVQKVTTKLRPDEGHLHLLIDRRLVSMSFSGAVGQVDIGDLHSGDHVLQVEFVAADHAPFEPRVVTDVPFRVG